MFQPGISGNPRGRPKGHFGGRIQALAALDRLLARKKLPAALPLPSLPGRSHPDETVFPCTLFPAQRIAGAASRSLIICN